MVTTKNTAHQNFPTRCSKVQFWVLKTQNSLFKKLLLDKNLVGTNFLKFIKIRALWSKLTYL